MTQRFRVLAQITFLVEHIQDVIEDKRLVVKQNWEILR